MPAVSDADVSGLYNMLYNIDNVQDSQCERQYLTSLTVRALPERDIFSVWPLSKERHSDFALERATSNAHNEQSIDIRRCSTSFGVVGGAEECSTGSAAFIYWRQRLGMMITAASDAHKQPGGRRCRPGSQ